jgi:hypothetical protein
MCCTKYIKLTYYLEAIFVNLSAYFILQTTGQFSMNFDLWTLHLN